jgi:hypothetical protein
MSNDNVSNIFISLIVKNVWSYTSTPQLSTRDNFTFTWEVNLTYKIEIVGMYINF